VHAITRHVRELDRYEEDIRHREWEYRRPRPRDEYPVGVMGLGVLGTRVAQAVAHFDYPVAGWSRTPKEVAGVRGYVGDEQFKDFLRATRILVCLLPLTAQTRDIMNTKTLALLQPGGFVINVARGAHLVDDDLIALLDSGHLAGAALDVFRTEPLPEAHPFWTHPKITITPHTSARTLRDETIAQIARKMRAFERGEPIAGVVDRLRGY
ncbi:MAG: glyoxylate/hydroxypyruvate reductase A, partial [Ramlibacter sp.]|nr:glyoxylate/hydroxypyruvate reductase A [Ramlibacter sp.]